MYAVNMAAWVLAVVNIWYRRNVNMRRWPTWVVFILNMFVSVPQRLNFTTCFDCRNISGGCAFTGFVVLLTCREGGVRGRQIQDVCLHVACHICIHTHILSVSLIDLMPIHIYPSIGNSRLVFRLIVIWWCLHVISWGIVSFTLLYVHYRCQGRVFFALVCLFVCILHKVLEAIWILMVIQTISIQVFNFRLHCLCLAKIELKSKLYPGFGDPQCLRNHRKFLA